jgi:hypothetical protein
VTIDLHYKLKIFAVTGDCPALKSVLKFIGHGGYWCCWVCYLRGVHDGGKRQYRYESPIELRATDVYFKESCQAEQDGQPVFGHRGISPLHRILDIPLPQSIIIDYVHATLLGHGKTIISAIYAKLKPVQRSIVDLELKGQPFPHFFNRKIRPISDFGFVKATEVRNILFYGLLPCLQQHLCIQRLSHMALFVCAVRLFHCDSLHGSDVVAVADELLISYYRDHDNYYNGLQNFVLHLHSHYSTIYTNHGALSNLGCFGQEDLIGNFSSSHNGTRYYGELICHYYNIDFSLNRSGERKERDGPIDPSGESPHQAEHAHECHRRLCGCNDLDRCIVIYRRCIVREQLYHSLIYHRSPKSISYFVQYSIDESMDQVNFGAIQCFVTLSDKPFALMRHHPMKHLYSDHFKSSKYYRSLKERNLSIIFSMYSKKSLAD